LSLSQTPFGWRVTPNRVMLAPDETHFQPDLAGGRWAFRSRASFEVEILMLRDQLNVLRRNSAKRPAFTNIDRLVFAGLSFPKISSGLESHRKAESAHHCERCLQSCTRSECSSPTCSGREAGLKPRICFSAISSTSLCGGHHLVCVCAAVTVYCSYG